VLHGGRAPLVAELGQAASRRRPGDKPKYQARPVRAQEHRRYHGGAEGGGAPHYPNVTDPMVLLDPKNKNSAVKDQGLKVSVKDGGLEPINKTTAGYVPGFPFVSGKSEKAVPCFHRKDGRVVALLPEEIETLLYAGCWVDIKYKIIKSTSAGNPGEFFGLQSIMKLGRRHLVRQRRAAAARPRIGATASPSKTRTRTRSCRTRASRRTTGTAPSSTSASAAPSGSDPCREAPY
jgi:hypothetical protein